MNQLVHKALMGLMFTFLLFVHSSTRAEVLYEVSWDDHKVWLLGTIHLVSDPETVLSDTARNAISASDVIWLEMTSQELARSSSILFDLGVRSEPFLTEELEAEQWNALAAMTSRLGLAPSTVSRMEPWLLEYVVLVLTLRREGFDNALGIDMQVIEYATETNTAVKGLETAEEQVAMLADAREDVELVDHIQLILDDSESAVSELQALETLWQAGDLVALMEAVTLDMSEYTQHVLLVERNQKWFRDIKNQIQPGQNVFVGVGAGHLGGEQGLIQLFERAGATITRH